MLNPFNAVQLDQAYKENSELRLKVAALEAEVEKFTSTNSRYETALSVLQEYYSSADFTVIDFRDWCKQRLPNSCKDKPAWLGTGNRTSAA